MCRADKNIRHRACALQDAANALVDTELDWGFEKICQDIVQARKERGEESVPYVPKNYHVAPRPAPVATDAPVPDLPHVQASNEEGGSKRYSRRLRGLVVASDEEDTTENGATEVTEDAAEDMPDTSTLDSQSSSKPSSSSKGGEASGGERRAYPVVRRRKSPWFGSHHKVTSRSLAKRRRSSSDGAGKNSDSALPAAKVVAKDRLSSTETRQVAASARLKEASPGTAESSSKAQQVKVAQAEGSQAGEAMENASSVEVSAAAEQVLQLNRGWLEELEDRTVNETEGATVEQLERLYCALLNVARHHRRSWDRNVMLLEMAQQLDSFKSLLSPQTRT
ncbi:hypothetical protein MRX96_058988 [Rhipicephalus microplus]